MQGWDRVPMATQGQLLYDACMMVDGEPNAITLPVELLAFIGANKPMTV